MLLFPAPDITDVICADVMRAPTNSKSCDSEFENQIRKKNVKEMGRPAQQRKKNTAEYIQRREDGEAGKEAKLGAESEMHPQNGHKGISGV